MKVRINRQCMGDRNCIKLCPEVFAYDEDQLLAIVKFNKIPEQDHELVRRAARECVPEGIELKDECVDKTAGTTRSRPAEYWRATHYFAA